LLLVVPLAAVETRTPRLGRTEAFHGRSGRSPSNTSKSSCCPLPGRHWHGFGGSLSCVRGDGSL
jgi:hypothetical protein